MKLRENLYYSETHRKPLLQWNLQKTCIKVKLIENLYYSETYRKPVLQ